MPDEELTEKDYRVALKAALVINAVGDALDAMTGIAIHLVRRDQTQQGANILAFVMNHPDVRHDTFDRAEDVVLYMEEHLCPRVLEDAKAFRLGKSLNSIAAYIDQLDTDPAGQ